MRVVIEKVLSIPIMYVCWASLVLFQLTKRWDSFRLIPMLILLRVLGVMFRWVNRIVDTAHARKVRRDIAVLHATVMNEYTAATCGTKFQRRIQAVKLGIGAHPTVRKVGMNHFRTFLGKAASQSSVQH